MWFARITFSCGFEVDIITRFGANELNLVFSSCLAQRK
jgi:hypothetical protein